MTTKHDSGKERWDLIPWFALRAVVRVLTFGAKKYGPQNWRTVPEAKDRYTAALLRHVSAWIMGQKEDEETGENHLAHAMCCLMFLLELEEGKWEEVTSPKTDEKPKGRALFWEVDPSLDQHGYTLWQCSVTGAPVMVAGIFLSVLQRSFVLCKEVGSVNVKLDTEYPLAAQENALKYLLSYGQVKSGDVVSLSDGSKLDL